MKLNTDDKLKVLADVVYAAVQLVEPATLTTSARCRVCGGKASSDRSPLIDGGRESFRFCAVCSPGLAATLTEYDNLAQQRAERERAVIDAYAWRRLCADRLREVGPAYDHCLFRRFIAGTASQADALAQVRKWASDAAVRQRVPFVLLTGSPGLGKTFLAVCAWRSIARLTPTKVATIGMFIDETEFASRWRKAHARDSEPSADDLLDQVADAPLLFIDDLGKVKNTEAWAAALFYLINHRVTKQLPTFMTSNLAPEALATRLEASLADRLTSGVVVRMTGQSLRGAAAA